MFALEVSYTLHVLWGSTKTISGDRWQITSLEASETGVDRKTFDINKLFAHSAICRTLPAKRFLSDETRASRNARVCDADGICWGSLEDGTQSGDVLAEYSSSSNLGSGSNISG